MHHKQTLKDSIIFSRWSTLSSQAVALRVLEAKKSCAIESAKALKNPCAPPAQQGDLCLRFQALVPIVAFGRI